MTLNGFFRVLRTALTALALCALAACQADEMASIGGGTGPKATRPVSESLRAVMAQRDMEASSPILVRIFKEESVLEVWKENRSGRFDLLTTFEICSWSGRLGPKTREGDRQAPEGFYTITPAQMNPNSSYYLAFNTGYPNAYDRVHGHTGTHLMVHGSCSSSGCYAMSDENIQEIYALARDAFQGGQQSFQLQAFPFRMTAENMGRHWDDPNIAFWRMLKEGYDHFDLARLPPRVDVCGRRYVFNASAGARAAMSPGADCPILDVPQELQIQVVARQQQDTARSIEIAATVQAERDAENERLIAAVEQRRETEQRIEAERQETMLAAAEPAEPAVAPATNTPLVAANGQALPRRDPREPMLAMQVEPPSRTAGFFAQLFGRSEPEPPVMTVSAPIAAAAPVPATITADEAAAAISGAAGQVAPATSAAAPSAEVAAVETAPAEAPVAAPVQVAVPVPAEEPGLFDRLTSWF